MYDIKGKEIMKSVIGFVNDTRKYINTPTNEENMKHVICSEMQKW